MGVMFRKFFVSWAVLMTMFAWLMDAKSSFEAIFSLGDSNSDTGGYYSVFPTELAPYGMTYFKRPTGRLSDGRLYIDFLAEALQLPFLSPYLQSIGSDYRHGVNFAASGATVLQPNNSLFVSPFSLDVQINQMKLFKARVEDFMSQGQTDLPPPHIYGEALYVIYIGQNDFTAGFEQIAPQIISKITAAVKELHRLGGRTFMVLNLGPVGCYPTFLVKYHPATSDIDQSGCMISVNNAVNDYNSLLKAGLDQTRQELSNQTKLLYVDTYSAIHELFKNPTSHGFEHGPTACCGFGGGSYNYDPRVFCGSSGVVEGRNATASACSDPHKYVSWDGIHLTEAANKILAHAILTGSYSDPVFSFQNYCDIQPIG